jgi:hypothetical protein
MPNAGLRYVNEIRADIFFALLRWRRSWMRSSASPSNRASVIIFLGGSEKSIRMLARCGLTSQKNSPAAVDDADNSARDFAVWSWRFSRITESSGPDIFLLRSLVYERGTPIARNDPTSGICSFQPRMYKSAIRCNAERVSGVDFLSFSRKERGGKKRKKRHSTLICFSIKCYSAEMAEIGFGVDSLEN